MNAQGKIKTVYSATPIASLATVAQDLFVGKSVHLGTLILVYHALNLNHMVEEQDMHYGPKVNVTRSTNKDVRKADFSTILNANQDTR